jgi:hypothetical protein
MLMTSLLLAVAVVVPAADAPAPAVAMVLTVKGTVTLEVSQAKPRNLLAMDMLLAGDKPTAEAKAETLIVFLADGHLERLKSKAAATVAVEGCMPAEAVERIDGGKKIGDGQLAGLRQMARSGRGGIGTIRGDVPARPPVVTPMLGAVVIGTRPTLSWPAKDGARGYKVELRSGDDQRSEWKSPATDPRLPFPDKEKELKLGAKYNWRVTALLADDKEEVLVKSHFLVATQREADELTQLEPLAKSKDAGDKLLAAVAYESRGVFDEALRLYEQLAEAAPKEGNFQAALAYYYERAGRPDKAKTARDRARELGAVVPEK